VLLEETAEDAHTSHPDNLLGHASILGSETLTSAGVTNLAAGLGELTSTEARVHSNGFADDETILHETTDVLARVGVGDLVDLIGVEPDLSLSALKNCRREAFLQAQIAAAHSAACFPNEGKKDRK
ncbi:hypothetical protein PMAYCL1PPCAC_02465, partial [Pristionchus mayeri]